MQPTRNGTLLKAALRKAGVTGAPGRPPAPEQIQEAIDEENRMIGSWNVDELNIFTENRAIYNCIPNQQTNTIGIAPTGTPQADFNGPRPFAINGADLLLSAPDASGPSNDQQQINSVRRTIKIWNRQDWEQRKYQAVYTYPEGLYYDAGFDPVTGFGTIMWWPIPDQNYWVQLFVWQPIPKFQSGSDIVMLPDGYEDAIVNGLAVRLNQFPWTVKVPMDSSVIVEAQRSLSVIQQMNIRVPRLYADRELGSRHGGGVYWPTGLGYDD